MNTGERIYSGKTKDIHRLSNSHLLIEFKDDVTGENGVVDPGANTVVGRIQGKGRMSLELTRHFFQRLQDEGIPTHLVSVDLDRNAMEVREAAVPGKDRSGAGGLEFVCRRKAYGGFLKRYGTLVEKELQDLDYLVEITLKDDERGDPLINDDALVTLGLLTRPQLDTARELTRRIARIVENDLRERGLDLIDMKVEFGLIDGAVVLIDEISADAMRVMDSSGRILTHEEIHRGILPPDGRDG